MLHCVTQVKSTKQTNQSSHHLLHLVATCTQSATCLSNRCVRGGERCMQSKNEMRGACSSIKAPVNYTVPCDVNARQHPRAMTVLCGFNSETPNQSLFLPRSHQPHAFTATSLYCHTDLLLRWNICSHSSPMSPSPPSTGYRWSSQVLTWATTNLFMVCCRTAGVLIQTAETTVTAQPTMEAHGGCRGTAKDGGNSSESHIVGFTYRRRYQVLDKSLIHFE